MSTKGLRHHMVMHSHHHRWATRRTTSAMGKLSSSDAAAVPVQNGRRVNKRCRKPQQDQPKQTFPPQEPPTESRGSFDAFFSAQFGEGATGSSSSSSSPSSPSPSSSSTTNSHKSHSINPNPYYSPHLFISGQHHSQHHTSTGKLNYSIDPTAGGAFAPIPPSPEADLRPVHPYFADLGLPCGSVHNTLAHLFAAEKLWQHRWQKQIPSHELTALWGEEHTANGFQWSDYCSKQLGLPMINLDSDGAGAGGGMETHYLLNMNLSQQHDLAQMVMSKLSLQLDSQNTDWISLIQGTSEPDLFEELAYFGTDYTPSRLLLPPTATTITTTTTTPPPTTSPLSSNVPHTITPEDFVSDKAKLTSMQRLTVLNHLFMHATHHRSQILTATSQFTGDQTVVDLSAFVPEWKQIHSKVFRWA